VAYLQPAEVRPGLLAAIAKTPIVAPYFDLSFQHASPTVLRRMRRFGGTKEFLSLIDEIRTLSPEAGIRSNVIVGFPGESEQEFADLLDFIERARMDAVGVFGYSDEDGTEAATLEGKIDDDVIRARVEAVTALAEEIMMQRAEDRIGTSVRVLVESVEVNDEGDRIGVGRSGHQGPDDGGTLVFIGDREVAVGDVLDCEVVGTDGVDLIAECA
jgi:hypothetical protein